MKVHSEFGPLWAIQKKRVKKMSNGLMPMIEDVVQILENSIDTNKVNFLVLYLSETLETGVHDVIVVPTKEMRKNLERQNIKSINIVVVMQKKSVYKFKGCSRC